MTQVAVGAHGCAASAALAKHLWTRALSDGIIATQKDRVG
jgi:hypothetical protein